MKTVVVDCSAVVPWYFPEKQSGCSEKLFSEFKEKMTICIAPAFLQAEFGNVAWKKISHGECSYEQAARQLELFLSTEIRFIDCRHLLTAAFFHAHRFRTTVYDSLYIVLALALKARLATLDEKMGSIAATCGVSIY